MNFGEIIIYLIIGALVFVMFIVHLVEKENNKNTKSKHLPMEKTSKNTTNNTKMSSSKNDLSDFRITVNAYSGYGGYDNYNKHKSKNRTPGKWIHNGETVRVGKYTLTGGMFYLGGKLKDEPSLIDNSLNTTVTDNDTESDEYFYYDSYINFQPKERAVYLKWLSGNRDNQDTDIKYLLLYLYGIERRLIFDSKKGLISFNEYSILTSELIRLKTVYGDDKSFAGKINRLLVFTWYTFNKDLNIDPPFELLERHYEFNDLARIYLGKLVSEGRGIDSNAALIWINNDTSVYLRTPAHRCKEEFLALFKIRYLKKYKDGLIFKPNKTRIKLIYNPNNHSLSWKQINVDLPDVSVLSAPIKKIMTIAESCMLSLDSYSRYLGRNNQPNTLYAATLLPKELTRNIENKIFNNLKNWLDKNVALNNGLVSVNELLNHFKEEAPIKVNKKEAIFISSILKIAGFNMAPDIRLHFAKPELDGMIVIYPNDSNKILNTSQEYNIIGLILRLGSMVAVIDNHIHEAEVQYLQNLIYSNNNLSDLEKMSLNAYLTWRLNSTVNMSGLKARIEQINDDDKSAISDIIVNVALADGEIKTSEINQLQKLYSSLGLDKELVLSDIHRLSFSQNSSSNIGISKWNKKSQDLVKAASFSLNKGLIKSHEEDTKIVKSVLESIFSDENIIEEEKETTPMKSNPVFLKLDEEHLYLYEFLVAKEEWSRNEVEEKCNELNLMLGGSIEIINDWAYDCVEEPLIDDDETIFVNIEVVEEINALESGEIN